jgi:DNA modification methylase
MAQRELAISYRRVEELVPYARNAWQHPEAQLAHIVQSIREFGWTNPILIDESGGIIAGHGRVLAAQKLKITRVPCIVLEGLSAEQRRAYVVADNKLATLGRWDLALLASELKGLEVAGFKLALTGFSPIELKELIGADAPVRTGLTADDAAPALGPAVSRLGDVWELGRHRVMCGDAREAEALQTLVTSPEAADLVWTDPPYNVDYQGKAGSIENDNLSADAFAELLKRAFSNTARAMRAGAVIYVAHADSEREAFSHAFSREFKLAQVLIWVKQSAALSRQDYNWKHEPILYGWKEGAGHYFCGDFTRTTVIDEERDLSKLKREELLFECQQLRALLPSTVQRFDRPAKSELHPTMKPVALVQQLLRNSALEGQVVLDPFGGSGTTLIAAEKEGMSARLLELDPRYVDVIVRRWEAFTGKKSVHAGSDRPFGELARERSPVPIKTRESAPQAADGAHA